MALSDIQAQLQAQADYENAAAGLGAGIAPTTAAPVDPMTAQMQSHLARQEQNRQDQALAQQQAEADAILAQQAAIPESERMRQQMMGEAMGSMTGLGQALAATRTRVNPAKKFVEQHAQEQLAGTGVLLPPEEYRRDEFVAPERGPMESDEDYAMRVGLFQTIHEQEQDQAAQEYAQWREGITGVPDAREVGTAGEIGFIESERRTGEQDIGAREEQVTRMTEAETAASEARRAEISEARAAFAEQQDFADQQRDAMLATQKTMDVARKKLEDFPAINTRRYTEELPVWKRVIGFIGAFAGGAAGKGGQLAAMLQRENERETREQELAYEMGMANYEAAQDAVGQSMNLYAVVRDGIGDAQAAQMMSLQLMEEEQLALLDEEMAKTTEPIALAELQQARLQLEQGLREREKAIALQAETTPGSFTTHAIQGSARRRLERQYDLALKQFGELGVKGIDMAVAREGLEADIRKAQASAGGDDQKMAMTHAKDVAKMAAANSILEDFMAKARTEDVAGRGFDAYFATEEGRAVRESIMEALRRQLRYESQGVIGEDEIKDRTDALYSGWGDNELLDNVARIVDANNREIEAREYGMSEGARQIYYRNPNLAPLEARGGRRASRGAEGDAQRLGGRVDE